MQQYDVTKNLGPLGKFLAGYESIFADKTPNPNPNIITPASTRRPIGPAFGPSGGRSVMEHHQLVNPANLAPMKSHGENLWKPEVTQEKPYEDPGPSVMFSPQATAPSALPVLPAYEPIYDQAARENYDTSMGEIRGALDPVMAKRTALADELENYQGGALGSALALNMLFNNVLPAQENIATNQAKLKGNLVRRPLEGVHYGMEARTAGRKKLFEEDLPSTQSEIGYREALSEKAKQDSKIQRPQSALAGYTADYLASLPAAERNAIIKSNLMGKKDASSGALDHNILSIMADPAKGEFFDAETLTAMARSLPDDNPTKLLLTQKAIQKTQAAKTAKK